VQNPLHQFLIKTLIPIEIAGHDVSFTNASFFMVLVTLSIIAVQYFGLRGNTLVPGRIQALFEASYDFIAHMVEDNAGKDARPFAPLIFSLFMFILFANLLGMLPYSFTVTSHLAVTFALAIFIFVLVTIVGLVKHGMKFFTLFYPEGIPVWIAFIIVPIEIISYFIRPITLSFRLFLNMMAGHILLKVFAGFASTMAMYFAIGPVIFDVLFIGFEFFIAALQAYIFTILSCIYLNDAINLH
jgi:F-type H+-transporting ATPase subunit a